MTVRCALARGRHTVAEGHLRTALAWQTELGAALEAARTRQWREVGLGAQVLKDLGVRSIRLLSTSQHTYVGLGGFGIEITETEGLEG